ncbi:eukaryotic translation initiation factor 4B3-like [Aristolochia californica]|uniref:eukaryotic translation initiation factor 4B3-like n=1 Tax=Aristolochia californica TaxID=171875 RepID=UPI0035E2634A
MATVSAWAKPGAWALDSEQQEEEEVMNSAVAETHQEPLADFPSLAVAATSKTSKKKKAQPVSLAEFTTGKQVTHGAAKLPAQSRSVGLTPDEVLSLPTGPRERSAEELERSRLGGGFRSFGNGPRDSDRRGGFSGSDESGTTRWGLGRVSDEPRRREGFVKESGPSRADEADDWGAAKKFTPSPSFERKERGVSFDSHSRADEVDSWKSGKSSVPSEPRRERRGGFEMFQKETSNGGDSSDTWGRKTEESSGRPRLVLQPRSAPLSDGEANPGSAKTKGSNPFGEARPREEVLAEKGQDWKKIDEHLESVKFKEVGSGDWNSSGKKSFGLGDGMTNHSLDRMEGTWRKPASVDASPRSAAETETIAQEVAAN